MPPTDVIAMVLMAAAAGVGLAAWAGLFKDGAVRAGRDLENRRDAESALATGEALPKQAELLRSKEALVAEVVRTVRAGGPDEQSAAKVERALERIDAIDREAEEVRARVEARREEIEREYAGLIEERRAAARTMNLWRCATLVCAVAGAVLLGVGLV
ncbi:hypothetical protein [Nocardiopsis potens]|uniref:hypothetical protein n=1 Tax=Nocardiopsis potens TaxID=1246458 RepID=UPI000344F7CD|nr:hypothetical protein [Nocardiopsis potens]